MDRAHPHCPIQGELTIERTHEVSTGNVFADLGLPNFDHELVKAKLTVQIYQILKDRALTQTEAARLLGTTQAQVSALMRCRPASISVGRLMAFWSRSSLPPRTRRAPRPASGERALTVTRPKTLLSLKSLIDLGL
jgi:predicted XRE-type DNA-binding protein